MRLTAARSLSLLLITGNKCTPPRTSREFLAEPPALFLCQRHPAAMRRRFPSFACSLQSVFLFSNSLLDLGALLAEGTPGPFFRVWAEDLPAS